MKRLGRKHINLICHSSFGRIEYGKYPVAWADVYVEYKGGVYRAKAKRNSKKDRTVYIGPTLIDGSSMDSSIEFEQGMIDEAKQELAQGFLNPSIFDEVESRIIGEELTTAEGVTIEPLTIPKQEFDAVKQQESIDYYIRERDALVAIKERLASGEAFVIEANDDHNEDIPNVYTREPLTRKVAEQAIAFLLRSRGMMMPLKMVWERPDTIVHAIGL